ncbi:hypothetical protein FRC10_005575 [Ceratobasidium sp. 414]|nr:hypothetical protein FRC10_005575 [Ceratobasidium sp. 414]
MFAAKLALAAISALSAVYIAGAVPTGLTPREDWKTALGWDGKLDPSNTVKPTPGVSVPLVQCALTSKGLKSMFPGWKSRCESGYATQEIGVVPEYSAKLAGVLEASGALLSAQAGGATPPNPEHSGMLRSARGVRDVISADLLRSSEPKSQSPEHSGGLQGTTHVLSSTPATPL